QVLAKATAADYDTPWIDAPTGGGGAVSSVNRKTGGVVLPSADTMLDEGLPASGRDVLEQFPQMLADFTGYSADELSSKANIDELATKANIDDIPEQRVHGGHIYIQEAPPPNPQPGDIHLW